MSNEIIPPIGTTYSEPSFNSTNWISECEVISEPTTDFYGLKRVKVKHHFPQHKHIAIAYYYPTIERVNELLQTKKTIIISCLSAVIQHYQKEYLKVH